MLQKHIQRLQALAQEYKALRAAAMNLPVEPAAELKISASVGYKGKNLPADVLLVRQLLNKFGYQLEESSNYDLQLQNAIYDFQIKHCQMSSQDERDTAEAQKIGWADQLISPSGNTWKTLASGKSKGAAPQKTPPTPKTTPAADIDDTNGQLIISRKRAKHLRTWD